MFPLFRFVFWFPLHTSVYFSPITLLFCSELCVSTVCLVFGWKRAVFSMACRCNRQECGRWPSLLEQVERWGTKAACHFWHTLALHFRKCLKKYCIIYRAISLINLSGVKISEYRIMGHSLVTLLYGKVLALFKNGHSFESCFFIYIYIYIFFDLEKF